MSTILVYDYDFFHYNTVIPNLECAKYAAWRKKKKDIVVFSPNFNPSMYTKTFFRKEYDDGIYDTAILQPSVEYGGRAFSKKYKPFDLEMERIAPDFEIYRKYKSFYGKGPAKEEQFKTVVNATHTRLSLDGQHLEKFPYDRLRPSHPNVILHDYDLAAVEGSFELLEDISRRRPSGLPYKIGNKYPINVYNFNELSRWLMLPPMTSSFYIQYNGLFTTDEIVEITNRSFLGLRQLIYNVSYNCSDENDFMIRVLPEFYKQLLFLRSYDIRISLNIDEQFFKTRELKILMRLLNCFHNRKFNEYIRPQERTLYTYCAWSRRAEVETFPWAHIIVSQQEMRDCFQYIRKHNYEVFDMFYGMPNVVLKGGKLVNEWSRN